MPNLEQRLEGYRREVRVLGSYLTGPALCASDRKQKRRQERLTDLLQRLIPALERVIESGAGMTGSEALPVSGRQA